MPALSASAGKRTKGWLDLGVRGRGCGGWWWKVRDFSVSARPPSGVPDMQNENAV